MTHIELTHKDRAFAATAGISGTPRTTPPATPPRSSSEVDLRSNEGLSLPRSAYLIIFVEGCERFCYYGLKTVLLLYFMHFIHLNKDSATSGYHLFSFACYFTPTIGAIISDGFIGRYWTIVILSLVYFIGTVVLTVTAVPAIGGKELFGPAIGLALISFGTGGIKPCVSAFGADQISLTNPRRLSRFFAFFYFAINSGSLLSTIITPILRSQVHCFGYDCYTLAFGVPSLLMLIAIIIFIAGTSLYKRVPPKENIIVRFIAVILRAIRNAICRSSSGPKEHWIYYADDKYSTQDMDDVRSVLSVCLLFTPIPVFHALFNQSGSRWTYQASLMNGSLGPLGTIQPDQMQALNSLFVLLFIPLFEEVIYPACARCNFLIRPLQRMFLGMIVMVFAFIAAGIIQIAIQSKANAIPVRFHTQIFNNYDCAININSNYSLEPKKASSIIFEFPCKRLLKEGLSVSSTCNQANVGYKLFTDELCPSLLIISEIDDEARGKTMATIPLGNSITEQRGVKEFALLRVVSLDGKQTVVTTLPNEYRYDIKKKLFPTDYKTVLSARYHIVNQANGQKSAETFETLTTGVYTVLIYNTEDSKLHVVLIEDVPPFTVHILWQTIQYILMTAAEMLVSITGLIFAYSQAPKRYKSVIMSAWLLTTAFGDLIVVLVAEVRLVKDQAGEFFLFAGLMACAALVFGALGLRYKEIKPTDDDSEDQQLIIDKTAPEPEDVIPLSN
ncbi:unnamed protein product [Rotaria sp. Silwood1]|nr:unnamed protein product [Rotaria sp. Silwood1]CAF4587456.1 unnamed protein product [Rotaria sp. Silwood1]